MTEAVPSNQAENVSGPVEEANQTPGRAADNAEVGQPAGPEQANPGEELSGEAGAQGQPRLDPAEYQDLIALLTPLTAEPAPVPEQEQELLTPPQAQIRRALGRNDPCWCGSGKKYKKCHWQEERVGTEQGTE
jgi:hypothetical protein